MAVSWEIREAYQDLMMSIETFREMGIIMEDRRRNLRGNTAHSGNSQA